MIFFSLHHILKPLLDTFISHQTANLITFLLGIIGWTYLWVFVMDAQFQPTKPNFIISGLGAGFSYFLVSDIVAVCILYKNYWKQSIITELNDIFSPRLISHSPKDVTSVEPLTDTSTPTTDTTTTTVEAANDIDEQEQQKQHNSS